MAEEKTTKKTAPKKAKTPVKKATQTAPKKAPAKKTAKPKAPAKPQTTHETKPKTTDTTKKTAPTEKTETKKTAPAEKITKKTTPKKPEAKKKVAHSVSKIKFLPDASKKTPKSHPRFSRQELGRFAGLEDRWRRPRGIDSKKIEKKRGKGALPSIGYKKPVSEAQLHYGFRAKRVFNTTELSQVDPKTEAAVIASCVGRRKRNQIIEEANKLKITILNPARGEV